MSQPIQSPLGGLLRAFQDLKPLPIALWIVIGAFVVDTLSYFGILTLMTTSVSSDLKWGDGKAGLVVSAFTMLVTLFMLGVGSYAEGFGLRKAIVWGLILGLAGRILYSLAPNAGGGWVAGFALLGGLLLVALSSGVLQPVCYSGVKQYTDAKTSSMGYALIYAIMNLGIVVIGAVSSWIRPGVQGVLDKVPEKVAAADPVVRSLADISLSGVQAVNWVCAGVELVVLAAFMVFFTRRVETAKLRPEAIHPAGTDAGTPLGARMKTYFADGPFSNPRFLFFIFMLLPVRTLFAHQWLTMPQYILRVYEQSVADRMEWLVNWTNPLIIFFGVPLLTALTRRVHVYKMMVIGSLVSAAPTFLLALKPSLTLLLIYFVVFSIGEALWSARFLEYASELAPPGRISQYMGLAQIPWLLAKGTTGLYSGWVLAHYCPQDMPRESLNTGGMWILYGCIAMLSPVGLWLARKWVMVGMDPGKPPQPAN